MRVFELCIDNFDKKNLKNKYPELYDTLFVLYNRYNIDFLSDVNILSELKETFNLNKDSIKQYDSNLYYALLNFLDFLKQKGIYFKL